MGPLAQQYQRMFWRRPRFEGHNFQLHPVWLTFEMIGNNLIQEFVTGNMFITVNNNIRNMKGYVFLSSVPLLPVNGYAIL